MTRLRLLCHGSTSAIRTATFPADEPLDAQGQQKLATLSYHFRRVDRSLTSPALRARQTADALELNATVEPMLRDCDFGRWTGCTFDEVQAREPEAVAEWMRDPEATPHGGESIQSLLDRVASWLDEQGGIPGKAVAVTHAATIRAAVVHALGAPPRSFWRIDVAPLSLTTLSSNNGPWMLGSIGNLKATSVKFPFV